MRVTVPRSATVSMPSIMRMGIFTLPGSGMRSIAMEIRSHVDARSIASRVGTSEILITGASERERSRVFIRKKDRE